MSKEHLTSLKSRIQIDIGVLALAAAPQAPKSLRAAGPVLVVILIVAAAFLGYYQIFYYPTVAPTSTSTTSTTTTGPAEKIVVVTIPDGAQNPSTPSSQTYLPNVATVYIGYNATVMWINNDSVPHTVTSKAGSPDPSFNSFGPISAPYNNINPGANVTFTFTKPGDYPYYCSYHNWMSGEIIVKTAPQGLTLNSTTTTRVSST